jgi:hypothetical protein
MSNPASVARSVSGSSKASRKTCFKSLDMEGLYANPSRGWAAAQRQAFSRRSASG